jgi:multiple sugar transport system permease protein
MRTKNSGRHLLGKPGLWGSYIYLIILALFNVFPLLWIILSSLKTNGELIGNPTSMIPKEITFENYQKVFQSLNFGNNILNSIIVSGCTTIIAITISALGAYAVVRFFPKFGSFLTKGLIVSYMFPAILLAVPYSITLGQVGLLNTRIGLIIIYLSFSVPYALWLLVGFFKTVPIQIEEAASVDGANKFQIFVTVVLPIVAPGIVAVAIYTFINTWNEFLYSLVLINSRDKMTVAVALQSLQGQEILDWGVMMAASTVVVIPSVIFFMFIQKYIAGGLAAGSDK